MIRSRRLMLLWGATAMILGVMVPQIVREWRLRDAMRELISDQPEVEASAWARLKPHGRRAVRALLSALEDPAQAKCERVAEAVRKIDLAYAIGLLKERSRSDQAGRRATAARVLGRLHSLAAIDLLLPLLEDRDEETLRNAAIALAFILRSDPDRSIMGAADPGAVPVGNGEARDGVLGAFRSLLVKGHAEARAIAAYGLGQLRDDESISLLQRALHDRAPEVRFQAERALLELNAAGAPDGNEAADGR